MTHEEQLGVESLDAKLEDLRQIALGRVTHEYREAATLNAAGGGYLEHFVGVTPEPTVAFRMDSKDPYLGEDRRLARQKMIIYVPEGWDPYERVTRFWFQYIQHDGIESMFEVDHNGVRPYMITEELEEAAEAEEVGSIDITVENVMLAGVTQKRQSLATLSRLTNALREDFTHVRFRS